VVALARKALRRGDIDAELDGLFALIGLAFKDVGYAEEAEIRLVLPTFELEYLRDLKYRATPRGIVPYISLPLGPRTIALRHVRFGPSHPQDTFITIAELFKRHAPDVEYSGSELAYRP
jgi:hypothetical protein